MVFIHTYLSEEDNKQDISVWGCAPNQNKDVCKERSMDWFRERQKYPFPNFAELKCTDCTIGKFDEWYPEEYSLEPPVFPTTIPPYAYFLLNNGARTLKKC